MKTNTFGTYPIKAALMTSWARLAAGLAHKLCALLAVVGAVSMLSSTAGAVTIKKDMKFENLSASPLVVRNGGRVIFSAQLTYRDKKGNWGYLGYTSVPVTLNIPGLPALRQSVMTNRANGYVTFVVPIRLTNRIPANGISYTWNVAFDGDSELYSTSRSSQFTITN